MPPTHSLNYQAYELLLVNFWDYRNAVARTDHQGMHTALAIELKKTHHNSPALSSKQYDRSGRSTGVAIVVFTHARDAKLAQKQLDGVMAKGSGEGFGVVMGLICAVFGRRSDEH